jgi:hypothetical protein
MNKLKAFSSKVTSSTPGSKLSKAFKFNKNLNVLKKSGDPFHDGPVLEEVSLVRARRIFPFVILLASITRLLHFTTSALVRKDKPTKI